MYLNYFSSILEFDFEVQAHRVEAPNALPRHGRADVRADEDAVVQALQAQVDHLLEKFSPEDPLTLTGSRMFVAMLSPAVLSDSRWTQILNSSMVRVSDDEYPRFVSNEATNKIKSLENRIQELEKQIADTQKKNSENLKNKEKILRIFDLVNGRGNQDNQTCLILEF